MYTVLVYEYTGIFRDFAYNKMKKAYADPVLYPVKRLNCMHKPMVVIHCNLLFLSKQALHISKYISKFV